MIEKARTPRHAVRMFDVKPLEENDDRYHAFPKDVREFRLESIINEMVTSAEHGNCLRYALAGHRGCGKSTELRRLKDRLQQKGFMVFYVVINEIVNPYDIEYSDLFLVLSQTIVNGMNDKGYEMDQRLLQNISDWYKEVMNIDEEEVEMSLGVDSQAGIGVALPFLARLMATITSRIKASGSQKQIVREKVQKYPKALMDNTNLLLQEAHKKLKEKGEYDNILVIFDNLDRYQHEVIDNLLLQGSDLFDAVGCHTIFTIPISMVYQPRQVSIKDVFQSHRILPMIKIRQRHQAWDEYYEPGLDALIEAVEKRIHVDDVFEDRGILREIVGLTGGCLRDLMHLGNLLCNEAADEGKINREHLREAVRTFRNEYQREVSYKDYDKLAQIHLTKQVPNDAEFRRLLFLRHALEYENAGVWGDIHPILYGIEDFQKALKEAAETRSRRSEDSSGG